jgi:hypothetical protein
MIITIKNPKLRISEGIQFFGDVITVCEKANPAELNIQPQWSELKKSYKLLTNSFKKEQSSMLTAELATVDYRRDQGIICFRKLADGFTNHFDNAKAQAGKLLLTAIDKYGKQISKMNYQAETSVLDNLVTDLKSEDHAAAVKLLGLSDLVAELSNSNKAFNDIYLQRVEEAAAKDLDAAGALLYDCQLKYRELVKHIEANAIVNASEAYETLIKQLNSLIEQFNLLLAQRAGRVERQQEASQL